MKLLILGLLGLVFILFPGNEVLAHTGHEDTTPFNLGFWLQDAHETIVGWYSSDAKTELIAEHLAQVQVEKEKGVSDVLRSHAVDLRVDAKTEALELGVRPSVTQLITEVTLSGELTKINDLHNKFLDYRTTWFNDYRLPEYTQLSNFQSEINQLDLAVKYCDNIIATTLIKASEPFTEYLVERCPALDDVSPDLVLSVFDGANSDE